jgi:predicted ferric reductase
MPRNIAIRPLAQAAFWLTVYLALVMVPLVIAYWSPQPGAAGFGWDFAMTLGYAGVAMMGVQFVLTARFKRACAPFGIDVIYYFHRYLALAMLALIVVHALLAAALDPGAVGPLDPRRAVPAIGIGRLALLLIVALLISSLWRKRLGIEYDRWRRVHAVLAILALLLAVVHVDMAARMLNTPGKRLAWTLLSLAWLGLIVHVRVFRPWRLRRRPFRVCAVHAEHGRSVSLHLEPVDHAGFDYLPGQFAWLSLGNSPFALREHPFSLASSPTRPGTITFTIKALGDFSTAVGHCKPGATAYVDGPYGAFSCDRHANASGLVFIAGGVGIAPIISMLRALADRSDPRPLWLFYGNRLWQHTLFREELQELRTRLNLAVVHVLGEPDADWKGERGLLRQDILARHLPEQLGRLHYFICGPQPMIRVAECALKAMAVPLRHLHSEIFDLA